MCRSAVAAALVVASAAGLVYVLRVLRAVFDAVRAGELSLTEGGSPVRYQLRAREAARAFAVLRVRVGAVATAGAVDGLLGLAVHRLRRNPLEDHLGAGRAGGA